MNETVKHALGIAEEYRAQGLNLTLRQMYYQFVSRALCGSGQKQYQRIGAALTEARYSGEFPVDWLEDRGREFRPGDFETDATDVESALRTGSYWIRSIPQAVRRSRWFGQTTAVTVLFEKEALAGVFEPVCSELGVGWMACKGYPSVSALHQWLVTAERAADRGISHHVILYLGDHDPDGFGIPRSITDGFERLRQLDRHIGDYAIELKRIALNMAQIRQYDPPPFEAKESSPRFQRYVDEQHTRDAWELDALNPTVLRDLIREHVRRYFDPGIDRENQAVVRIRQAEVKERITAEWIGSVLAE